MRILMVTDSFFPAIGGSETAIHQLGEALIDQGHEVGVACMTQPDAASPSERFRFWKLSSRIGPVDAKYMGKIRSLRALLEDYRPDAINAHFLFESGYVAVRASRSLGIPCVVSIRGKGIFYRPSRPIERFLFPMWIRGACKADGFIATSQEMADIAHERHGIQVEAISNGVDTEAFRPGRDEFDVRSRHGLLPSKRVIVCARRFVKKNGIEYMIRALPKIAAVHDAVLLLAAPKERGYEELASVCREVGMEDRVQFMGSVLHDQLPCYFSQADVVVQPSIAEARSLACLEAMASGAAVVATATGGLKELIDHRNSGYLVDPFEESTYQVAPVDASGVERLAHGVNEVLGDESLRARIRDGAREYAQTCSWPEIARRSLRAYARAIDSRAS